MSDKIFSPERLLEAMNGMSNVDLAEKLGCARSSITMYLSGQRTPSKMTIQLMAICLGVNPAWLMGLNVPKYLEKPTPVSESGAFAPYQKELLDLVNDMDDDTIQSVLDIIKQVKKLKGE